MTWVAFGIVAISLGWFGWKHVITSWMPLEGVSKVAFVIGCWWGGGWFVYGGVSHQLYYWLVALLVGVGLLAWGCLLAINPILRWYFERPYWQAMERTAREQRQELELAALEQPGQRGRAA